ncbi:hypothetical protein [Ponticoccus alexandrii]|uniref:Uncharacterized protein n=1 Tax=Ponticoccus alexandrii TaxID=1943633 RepID=A0ABX7F344_9RHOB|nr:hypothetical protein [Ponticoccus alexandrii]ETA53604.1 hypothetical protein P279_02375 [Rhodobacteraceae bacterium PD-2]QRF64923.1 hypothetical protein GQA70_00510 [Ponticoccus alexandrii]
MKTGGSSLFTVWVYLEEIGLSGPVGDVLLFMCFAGGFILLSLWLFSRSGNSRSPIGETCIRPGVTTAAVREEVRDEFTFADALELTQTGTIRQKSLEERIVNSLIPIEILFSSEDHHPIYQLELNYKSEGEVTTWVEVAQVLGLPDIERVLQEIVLMRSVLCHPDFDPEYMSGDETIYDRLCRRAMELQREFAGIEGVARLRAASEEHLRRNAPDLLPLPVW